MTYPLQGKVVDQIARFEMTSDPSQGLQRCAERGDQPPCLRIQIGSKIERGAVRAGEDELGNRLIDDLDRDPDLTAFPEMIG